MTRALAEGTIDARLFLHAGLIARQAGDARSSRRLLARARSLAHTLLPSEHDLLAGDPEAPPIARERGPGRPHERTNP